MDCQEELATSCFHEDSCPSVVVVAAAAVEAACHLASYCTVVHYSSLHNCSVRPSCRPWDRHEVACPADASVDRLSSFVVVAVAAVACHSHSTSELDCAFSVL